MRSRPQLYSVTKSRYGVVHVATPTVNSTGLAKQQCCADVAFQQFRRSSTVPFASCQTWLRDISDSGCLHAHLWHRIVIWGMQGSQLWYKDLNQHRNKNALSVWHVSQHVAFVMYVTDCQGVYHYLPRWDCSHYWHFNLRVHGLRLDTSLAHVACSLTPKNYSGLTAATCSDINSQQSKIITALHLPACQHDIRSSSIWLQLLFTHS